MGIEETGLEDLDLEGLKGYVFDLIQRVKQLENNFQELDGRICELEDWKERHRKGHHAQFGKIGT